MVLDAPPHNNAEVLKNIENLMIIAAKKGIRVIPIMGSGVNKSTEYLFRSMALVTNGTYTFLTDDSGIGESHIKPTTDSYTVELLNKLLLRLIKQFVIIPDCNQNMVYDIKELHPDKNFIVTKHDTIQKTDSLKGTTDLRINKKPSWKIYPNPTKGELNVEIKGFILELFLTDNSGKILEKIDVNTSDTNFKLDLSNYPNGIYFIRYYYYKDRSVVGKVILNR